jgi:pimeloyl-ACP methyl ester carboxylesterase
MAARLRAQHVVIDKAAHSPSFEQPEATLDALLQFWRAMAATATDTAPVSA